MQKYRIKQIEDNFYPQKRTFLFFWENIEFEDKNIIDWYIDEYYAVNDDAHYITILDAWYNTRRVTPYFETLIVARTFIVDYLCFIHKSKKSKTKIYNLDKDLKVIND